MITVTLNGVNYYFKNTLRVLHEMRDTLGVKTMNEVMEKCQHFDFDQQLELAYAAYKICDTNAQPLLPHDQFIDMLLDAMGVHAIAKLTQQILEGLLYTGLSAEEKDKLTKQDGESLKNAESPAALA